MSDDVKGIRPMVKHPRQSQDSLQQLGASRMVVEGVSPEIDAGRFAAKAVAGWPLTISADVLDRKSVV